MPARSRAPRSPAGGEYNVHLIYREKNHETRSKDYEFSRTSMEERWQAGVNDTRRTLRHQDLWLTSPDDLAGVGTFDITRDSY